MRLSSQKKKSVYQNKVIIKAYNYIYVACLHESEKRKKKGVF